MSSQTSFPKSRRLCNKEDYSRVFAGRCMRSKQDALMMLAVPNHLGYPRLGMAIAKKQVRFAVARNRIKRAIRESFRHHQQSLGSIDFVVLARNKANSTSPLALQNELLQHWKRLCGKEMVAK